MPGAARACPMGGGQQKAMGRGRGEAPQRGPSRPGTASLHRPVSSDAAGSQARPRSHAHLRTRTGARTHTLTLTHLRTQTHTHARSHVRSLTDRHTGLYTHTAGVWVLRGASRTLSPSLWTRLGGVLGSGRGSEDRSRVRGLCEGSRLRRGPWTLNLPALGRGPAEVIPSWPGAPGPHAGQGRGDGGPAQLSGCIQASHRALGLDDVPGLSCSHTQDPRLGWGGAGRALTDEGHGLGVDDAAGQQMEVVLLAVHHHGVARIVAPLGTENKLAQHPGAQGPGPTLGRPAWQPASLQAALNAGAQESPLGCPGWCPVPQRV